MRIANDEIAIITLTTPNTPNEDMETLLVDPVSNDLYIIVKNHEEAASNIYRATPPVTTNTAPISMDLVGNVPRQMLVGGDMTEGLILLRAANNAGAWMWTRRAHESVEEALTRKGSCNLDLTDELQGEAIAVSSDGYGFYTTSEGENEPIFYYDFFFE